MSRKNLRPAVFQRDGGICSICKCNTESIIERYRVKNAETKENAIAAICWDWGVSTKAKVLWHVEHTIPIAAGGRDELSNVTTMCILCHRNKTSKIDVPLIAKVNRKRKKADTHSQRMREKFS